MIKVGVMRGGMSDEYEVSLRSGAQVLSALSAMPGKYKVVDMLVTRDGQWHINGLPVTIDRLRDSVDVVFNALHGGAGENGTLAQYLHHIGMPFTGSRALASALAMEKDLAKKKMAMLGVKVPQHYIVNAYTDELGISADDYVFEQTQKVFQSTPPPWIVKPVSGGSSIGIVVARTLQELGNALRMTLGLGVPLIVEEFIEGKEATVGVVEGLRGQEHYTLLPIEILKNKNEMFDFEHKYSDKGRTIVGGSLSYHEKHTLQHLAREVHKALELRHYSRSDFIVTSRGHIYFLEVNALPGLTEHSLVPQALSAVGISMPEFVDHVINQTLNEA